MSISFGSVRDYIGGATATVHTITGNTGVNKTGFVLTFSMSNTSVVSSVVGGGLTWTQQMTFDQATFRHQLWTGIGDASSNPFTITVTFTSAKTLSAHCVRYIGVDQLVEFVNGANNTGSSTTPNVTIATTGFQTGDMYVGGTSYSNAATLTHEGSWTQIGGINSLGPALHVQADSTTDNTANHTLSSSVGWLQSGGLLKASRSLIIPNRWNRSALRRM